MIGDEAQSASNWLRAFVPLAADLTSDSRAVRRGDVFIAYPGEKFDGRNFIAAAFENGASAVLFDPDGGFALTGDQAAAALALPNCKQRAGEVAAAWYGEPSRRLFSVGITGTSGKSTSALWLAQLYDALGHKSVLVGTLGAGMLGKLVDTGHTTPDPVDLEHLLSRLVAQGANVMAMEVTSVGLVEGRVNGLHFDVALFTNLSRDHLDYHGTIEAYRDAKARLFAWPGLLAGVINLDDAASAAMRSVLPSDARCITFSASGNLDADLYAIAIEPRHHSTRIAIGGRFGQRQVEAPVVGRYNIDNLLGVMAVALASGIEFDAIIAALAQITAAPGRLEPVLDDSSAGLPGPLVLIDYAHKPDALEKVLQSCRPMAEQRGGHLIAVFGCGGDRDRGKRPIMGEIAARLADRVVLTSDNPRSEEPVGIIEQILAGIGEARRDRIVCITDRGDAIETTLNKAGERDVVVIAGKGHEEYQEVAGVKMAFSDAREARRVLKAREVAAC